MKNLMNRRLDNVPLTMHHFIRLAVTTSSRILQQIPDYEQLTANQMLDHSEGLETSKPFEDTCGR
jgi:hypothetical protein